MSTKLYILSNVFETSKVVTLSAAHAQSLAVAMHVEAASASETGGGWMTLKAGKKCPRL
jgi:hypothetical protein